MHMKFLPAAIAGSVILSGCGAIGGLLDPFGNDDYNRNASPFERDAAAVCSREASQYGRVNVTDVRQRDRDYVDVRGRIETRDTRSDEFDCTYRSDRKIVSFRIY